MPRAQLSRRTLLRGTGAALALPWLEAMLPKHSAFAAAPQVKQPVRLAWVFFPNGTHPDAWQPKTPGRDWEITPSLEPLRHLKDQLTVLSGLAQVNARALGDGPGDHARSAAAFLTGAHPVKTGGAKIRAGRSADQIAADGYGRDCRLPSIELGTEAGKAAGACDSGYACAYSNNISWRSASQPMAKEINPRLAFDRLFGTGGPSKSTDELLLQRSILDLVADDARQLKSRMGETDRQKLDEYFSSVRDVEKRIERLSEPVQHDISGHRPVEQPEDIGQRMRLMYDVIALGFKTDTTRIATFMLGNEGSNGIYPMIGINEGHHHLSHHQNDSEKIAKIALIDKFFIEQFAYFVNQLKETNDGQHSLLDNCLIVYGGAIRDGNRHDHHDLPILLAGSGGGYVTPGSHLQYPSETPLNNLYLTMLDAVGVRVDQFGDSSGKLELA
ncbi:MAG: DUF1552 domain-containing protein [Pirellulaceae bacterium]|nr:DUF1552 domain-containing protein [Pirellulaceae bacterium]